MIRKEYYQRPTVIDDLINFDPSGTSLSIFGNAKNFERLKDLTITHLWLTDVKQKELQKIIPIVKPQFLNIYGGSVNDLSILETLKSTETIVLRWNTKAEMLWNIAENLSLNALVIEDFSKINAIDPIAHAINLNYLILEGGMWKPLKINTLNPLSGLKKLEFLRLANMHVKFDGLKPIAELIQLKELMLSNQFETSDYAYLAAKLANTKCDLFKPYISYEKPIGNNDTMITGKRKPFLNSNTDRDKIEKYAEEFKKMVKNFSV